MIIPSVPITKFIDNAGYVTSEWRIYFEQLSNQLQSFFPNSGYIFPFKSNAELDDLDDPSLVGRIAYGEEQKNMQVNTTGNYKPLTTYEELTTLEISAIPSGQRNGRFIFNTDLTVLLAGSNDTFIVI